MEDLMKVPVQLAHGMSFRRSRAPSVRALRGMACLSILARAWVVGDGLSAGKRKELQGAGWVERNGGSFTLLMPQDLRPVPVRPIDSIVYKWRSDTIELNSDQGAFSAAISNGEGTESLTLDGRQAIMRTATNESQRTGFAGYTEVYFPDIGIPVPIGPRLSIRAYGKAVTNLATTRTILESIRFTTNQVTGKAPSTSSRTNDLSRPRPPSPTGSGIKSP